ncbi:MAG: hypothetical protein ABGF52_09320 [Candidatus Asgardarchaeum sp.]
MRSINLLELLKNVKVILIITFICNVALSVFYLWTYLKFGDINTFKTAFALTFFVEFVVFLFLYSITPYSSKIIDPKHTYRYLPQMKYKEYLRYVSYLQKTEKTPEKKTELKDVFGILSIIFLLLSFLCKLLP